MAWPEPRGGDPARHCHEVETPLTLTPPSLQRGEGVLDPDGGASAGWPPAEAGQEVRAWTCWCVDGT